MSSTRLVICSVIFSLLFIEGVFSRDPRRGPGGSTTLGGDVFLQGKYLEIGVNPAGSFGSRNPPTTYAWGGSPAPNGYHPSVGTRLGIVVDWDKNGWAVGNPPQSGDFVLEGTGDVGFHITWHGKDGRQIFNQMPLFADDDDLDNSYTPPRGCTRCSNGKIPGCVDFDETGICNCPPLSPTSYTCPYLRWDMTTTSFEKVTNVSVAGQQRVKYVGKAMGSIFSPPNSGYVVGNGENLTVTREMWFNQDDTFIVEELTLTNTGTYTVYNVSALWHMQAAPEASPNNPNYMGNETDFQSWMSIPYQGSTGQNKVLVQSRSQWNSMTASMGTLDELARAWIIPSTNWSAPRGDEYLQQFRPYSADWVYMDTRTTQTERSRNAVMALANKRNSLAPGASVTFRVFHAFTPDAVTPAFAALVAGCDGVAGSGKVYDACGVCGGSGTTCVGCDGVVNSNKVYDACGVCGGAGTACLSGCDHAPFSTKTYDSCGVCGGSNACLSGCDHTPFSTKTYDSCGVCGGSNLCLGCDLVPYSGKKLDACGQCDGNNSTCAGCDGVPNSGKKLDACGDCGGNNSSCAGCDGVAKSGKSYDVCGVCGGVGKTCPTQCSCPTCENCQDVTCPDCECDFHGYTTKNLDFLIYRYEALNEVGDSLNNLADILSQQLTALRLTTQDVSDKLSSYQNFIECGHTTDTLLRFYFNLAQD